MSSHIRALAGAAAFAVAVGFGGAACSDAPPTPAPNAMAADSDDAAAEEAATPARPVRRPAQTRSHEPEGNQPPRIRTLAIRPADDDDDGSIWVAVVEAVDDEGDEIEFDYVWLVNDEPTNATGERFDASGLGRGDRFNVEVIPRDRHGAGPVAATGRVEVANAAPSITSQPPARMADGGVYRYTVEASDPDGDAPLRYELLQSPDGMRIDPYSGELQWRPSARQAGKHTIEIAVSDNRGARSTQLFDLPITSPGA